MRSRMAGRSILYCSPTFIVATRLLAATIASGGGVCADAAKAKHRKMPAMIDKCLHIKHLTGVRVPSHCRLLDPASYGLGSAMTLIYIKKRSGKSVSLIGAKREWSDSNSCTGYVGRLLRSL